MILCSIIGHNYTCPDWDRVLVNGTNPFCYRCGKPPENIYRLNQELIEINRELLKELKKKEKS